MIRVKTQPLMIFMFILITAAVLGKGLQCLRGSEADTNNVTIRIDPKMLSAEGPPHLTTTTQTTKISADILSEMVAGRSAIIVDARLGRSYKVGRIPGAVNLSALRPNHDVLQQILEFPKHVTVVVYCESANCKDSEEVAKILRKNDLKDVRILMGGFQAWRERGFPVAIGR